MNEFRPKSERLRQLQLAGVLGRQLPGHWEVSEQEFLHATRNEILPWCHDDEAEEFILESEQ